MNFKVGAKFDGDGDGDGDVDGDVASFGELRRRKVSLLGWRRGIELSHFYRPAEGSTYKFFNPFWSTY